MSMNKQLPKIVETERLIGSTPTLSNLNECCAMFQISDIKHWEEYGFGMWLWRDKESHEFIGRAGLKSLIIDDKSEVELGYAIKPEYWGKGIAIEMSLISIELAFNTLSLPQLTCFTQTQNYQSLRVMQKLGFHYEKDFIYLGFLQKLHRLVNFTAYYQQKNDF